MRARAHRARAALGAAAAVALGAAFALGDARASEGAAAPAAPEAPRGATLGAGAPLTGSALAELEPLVGPEDFPTPARAALLLDLETRTVLFAKDALRPLPPASISKLATLYAVFRLLREGSLSLEDEFEISEKAWKTGGSKMFVLVGDDISVGDLVRGVIVSSGNDASVALAEGVSGDEDAFASLLDRLAREELGLVASGFRNATGLPALSHRMSALDSAVLGARLVEDFPELYPLFAEEEFTWENITQRNRNRLLYEEGLGVDGLKTGHTSAAGYGLVASGEREGRRLVLAVLGLSSSGERTREAERILRWGWSRFGRFRLASEGEVLDEAAVWLGERPSVPLAASEDIVLVLPRGAVEPGGGLSMRARFDSPAPAPIAAGQRLGALSVSLDGVELVSSPLVAAAPVEPLSGPARLEAALRHLVFGAEAVLADGGEGEGAP